METGFVWENREGGLCSESDYPYIATDRMMCWDANCTEVPGTHVESFSRLNGGNVDELRQSIAIQPTSIAMAANSVSSPTPQAQRKSCVTLTLPFRFVSPVLYEILNRWNSNFIMRVFLTELAVMP